MRAAITVLPGDGIGPEVVAEATRVLAAVGERWGHTFTLREALIGGAAIDETGTALPPETLAVARETDAVLLGAVGGPKWDDPRAKVRPEQGLLGDPQGAGPLRQPAPGDGQPAAAARVAAAPRAAGGRRHAGRARADRRHLLRRQAARRRPRQRHAASTPSPRSSGSCAPRPASRAAAARSSAPSTRPTCWRRRACGAR